MNFDFRKDFFRLFSIFSLFLLSSKLTAINLIGFHLWMFIWLFLFLFLPIRYVLFLLIGYSLFFEESVWYVQEWVTYSTDAISIYDRELFGLFKAIEIFLISLVIKYFAKFKKINFPKLIQQIFYFWVLVIFYGILVGFFKQVPFTDIFIFSQFRGFIFAFILILMTLQIYQNALERLLLHIGMIVATKFLITLPEYIFGYYFLYPSTAQNYTDSLPAFFGSDSQVQISLLGGISLLIIIFNLRENFNNILKRQEFSIIYFLSFLPFLSVILSLRRGGLLFLASMVLLWIFLERRRLFRTVSRAPSLPLIILPLGFFLSLIFFPTLIQTWTFRFLGYGTAGLSNISHLIEIQDAWNKILEAPIFGSGLGSRFYAFRTVVHNLPPELNIYVHQGLFYNWLKMGIFGAFIYIFTYFALFKKLLFLRSSIQNNSKFSTLIISYYFGFFIWELFIVPFNASFQSSVAFLFPIIFIFCRTEFAEEKNYNQ